jgi:hypothetical protein
MHSIPKGDQGMPKKFSTMDQTTEERPQDVCDQRGTDYDNIASGWVRGAVGKPTMKNETAENMPHYDKSKKWK